MFNTVRVDRNDAQSIESLGTKRKFWFSKEGQRFLFKAEERGTGEDWAEKLACELARRIGLPHVEYELAEEYDRGTYLQPGVVCPNCAAHPLTLILGNQLLLARDARYPVQEHRKYAVRDHTVDAVVQCVQSLAPPGNQWITSLPRGIETALDVFTGYVLLDAWIANQDRHHENWGAIRSPQEAQLRLAPTFDHGASLARNLSDEERKERLESRDERRQVLHFAARARSAFYVSKDATRPLGTVEVCNSVSAVAPNAAKIWLETMNSVTPDEIEAIIREVPPNRMSAVTRRFTLELLVANQTRLLDI